MNEFMNNKMKSQANDINSFEERPYAKNKILVQINKDKEKYRKLDRVLKNSQIDAYDDMPEKI
jgi:hypothetical protein